MKSRDLFFAVTGAAAGIAAMSLAAHAQPKACEPEAVITHLSADGSRFAEQAGGRLRYCEVGRKGGGLFEPRATLRCSDWT